MAASLASSLATTFSVALRRSSLLPPTHQPPNSLSLAKPANFPSIRAHSAEDITTFIDGVAQDAKTIVSDGKSKAEEGVGKAMEFAADGWKEGKEMVEEGVAEMTEKANEIAGNVAGGAGDLKEKVVEKGVEVKESVEEGVKVVGDKGGEVVDKGVVDKGVATAVAAKETTVEVAGDVAKETKERVGDAVDAVNGKS